MKLNRTSSVLLSIVIITLGSCWGVSTIPLQSRLVGKWEWVKTVTPSATITPQSAGYKQNLHFDNDGSTDYVAFYRNDSLILRLNETRAAGEINDKDNTVIAKYGNAGYLKYYLKFNSQNTVQNIEVSELMQTFNETADTVRHYYVRAN